MKIVTSLVLTLFATSSVFAVTQTPVVKCDATLVIDEKETARIGMHVVRLEDGKYGAYILGGALPENELRDVKEVVTLSPVDAWQKGGVAHIASAAGLSRADFDKLSEVKVYTTGNFDDDAAGFRLAIFVDAKGKVISSGMFYGWGGPHKCDQSQ